jgi:hypothetical protein
MCEQGFLVIVFYARMFAHISLQAATAGISCCMICQSKWNVYHWQSDHECGTCMLVLLHIFLPVLGKMFSITLFMTDG